MVIDTGIFKMNGKSFALEMISTYGKKWIALLLVLSLPALAAGIFHDLRWIVVFFMIICLVAPLMLSFLYFYYGLSPLASFNVASHSLKFIENGILVTVFNIVADPDNEESSKYQDHYSTLIPYNRFSSYTSGTSSVTLLPRSPEKGFLWVPCDAFKSNQDFQDAIFMLLEKLRQKQPTLQSIN